jgi:hypothetical protein
MQFHSGSFPRVSSFLMDFLVPATATIAREQQINKSVLVKQGAKKCNKHPHPTVSISRKALHFSAAHAKRSLHGISCRIERGGGTIRGRNGILTRRGARRAVCCTQWRCNGVCHSFLGRSSQFQLCNMYNSGALVCLR